MTLKHSITISVSGNTGWFIYVIHCIETEQLPELESNLAAKSVSNYLNYVKIVFHIIMVYIQAVNDGHFEIYSSKLSVVCGMIGNKC